MESKALLKYYNIASVMKTDNILQLSLTSFDTTLNLLGVAAEFGILETQVGDKLLIIAIWSRF